MPPTTRTSPVRFSAVPAAEATDPTLRRDLLDTWVAASEAGGSVGFVPPVDRAAVAERLDALLARVAAGTDALGVLREGDDEAAGAADAAEPAVGMAVLVASASPLTAHWRTVMRVMVHPRLQRRGAGLVLLHGIHAHARGLGLEQLALTVRGGEGLERFYAHLGYEVVGRHPGAIRVRPGDDRDEVLLTVRL